MTPNFISHGGFLTCIPTARTILLPTGVLASVWTQTTPITDSLKVTQTG